MSYVFNSFALDFWVKCRKTGFEMGNSFMKTEVLLCKNVWLIILMANF